MHTGDIVEIISATNTETQRRTIADTALTSNVCSNNKAAKF